MDILLFVILGMLALRVVVTIINYSFRPYLPTVRRIKDEPLISLLINGDNESARMRHMLELLSRVHYPNMEILVGIYNPQEKSLSDIQKAALSDKRVRILEIKNLQKGWREDNQISNILGKQAKGSYLLFMDPDVELRGGILEILVSYMRAHKLGLISIFPSYDVRNRAEWLTFPILNQLYLSLYLLRRMRLSARPRATLACRRFMLFEGEVYRIFQPFEEAKKCKDGAREIALYLKRESIPVDWRIGDRRVKLLGCISWKRCVADVSHELMMFFGEYYFLGFVYGLFMCLWWIPFVIAGRWMLLLFGLAEILIAQAILASITRISVRKSILYFYPQMVVLLSVMWISLNHRLHKRRWHKQTCQYRT
ncbi:MAG: glycosyltransferase [Bacteroidales bacterium]